ncbi:protocadherin Fat 4 [Ixodes scapularis]
MDNSLSDINYFRHEDIDDRTVSIKVSKSLEDLVDRPDPQSVLKFKLTCRGASGTEEAFLPVTVYIQDVNDHAPEFQNVPYHLEVDELTPVGLTVFRGVHAIDRDKPNTPNSDVTYAIVGGNENNSFALSDPLEGIIVINKPLDFDHGPREYRLEIQARDHGSPESFQSLTSVTIRVKDADDQNPVFTRQVYKTNVTEAAVITGARLRVKLQTDAPVHAFDQDLGINAPLRYSIIHGNELGIFELQEQTAELFMVREVDLESLPSPVFTLQVQDHGSPESFQSLTSVTIRVKDADDQNPVFTRQVYKTNVTEAAVITGARLRVKLQTDAPVHAFDQDLGINAPLRYSIIHGNELGIFELQEQTAELFMVREVDLESLPSPVFTLQVQVSTRFFVILSFSLGRVLG